jgi:hypothetical protein
MLAYLTIIPPMYGYVSFFTWITGAVILVGLLVLWVFPSHSKKAALLLGITGMIQIFISGFVYYPHHIFVVIPLQFVFVGIIALTSGAIIAIYGSIKRKK